MANRFMIISADCHAAARWPDYESYFERRHLDAYREWYGASGKVEALRPGENRLFDKNFLDELDESDRAGGRSGSWDAEVRMRELDADGVAGEVIFPGAENSHVPFHGRRPSTRRTDAQPLEFLQAGARAYNRWLADLCAQNPDRCAGVVFVDFHDIDAAVEEIRRAMESGLRGGVLLPGEWGNLPSYNDPHYEPIWALCEELELPVNTHPLGNALENYEDLPGKTAIFLSEVKWYAHRPFTFALWSGVFERHPQLQFVLTEQMADWVPETLAYYDDLYSRPIFAQIREGLPLRPSEYWERQCHVGASFLARKEVALRGQIGVDKIMWGSDYPHAEGTWPHTKKKLAETFAGVAQDEITRMVGGNAAALYHFDPERLAPLVDRIGLAHSALAD
ncbi:MAG: amidohydrolase [Myxococcales bacterium]|nr:amidohydrolase [Myxococcales bacterium]